ncbi:hypothetical protein BJ508DRAFT_335247 [Ascobolus immersus RN42]|uniref:Uncharacterized protein n=1 Tax=Ascobolus immersus RN42 TaxID=1160509 RepID=A0A3N4HHG5_ASCIM|nr:hypothetical protein BJ508DRAFT_335247 [Ascobolus immersus RN42]
MATSTGVWASVLTQDLGCNGMDFDRISRPFFTSIWAHKDDVFGRFRALKDEVSIAIQALKEAEFSANNQDIKDDDLTCAWALKDDGLGHQSHRFPSAFKPPKTPIFRASL